MLWRTESVTGICSMAAHFVRAIAVDQACGKDPYMASEPTFTDLGGLQFFGHENPSCSRRITRNLGKPVPPMTLVEARSLEAYSVKNSRHAAAESRLIFRGSKQLAA